MAGRAFARSNEPIKDTGPYFFRNTEGTDAAQKSSRLPFTQNTKTLPKLEINQPGDKHEQEADAIADKVMSMIDRPTIGGSAAVPGIQRKCAHCEDEEKRRTIHRKEQSNSNTSAGGDLTSYVSTLGESGAPLSTEARNYFEPRFGFDFSKVKIHTNDEAAKSAGFMGARAYTYGHNIVFNSNEYSPTHVTGEKTTGA